MSSFRDFSAGRRAAVPLIFFGMGTEMFRLDGKVAWVTGGTKGLGLQMAHALAGVGASVAINSRNAAEAESTARALSEKHGVRAFGAGADVTSVGEVSQFVAEATSALGPVDILVNNAGINIRGPIDHLTPEQFQQVQSVNVTGLWLMTRGVVPLMKEQKSGRIINLASTLGLVGLANRTPYTASKGAVLQMTRGLGLELAPWNITCNAICPGPFLTPMNIPIADTAEAKQHIIGATALNRWGRMEEIQGAAIFLASDASSYMTGAYLAVDGGWTAR